MQIEDVGTGDRATTKQVQQPIHGDGRTRQYLNEREQAGNRAKGIARRAGL